VGFDFLGYADQHGAFLRVIGPRGPTVLVYTTSLGRGNQRNFSIYSLKQAFFLLNN